MAHEFGSGVENGDHGAAAGLDIAALEVVSSLISRVQGHGPQGPISYSLLSGGRSNLTYRLSDGATSWVLRRPPPCHVLETAHDMAREYRIMAALAKSAVPVPSVLFFVEDAALIGSPFYVMSMVDGEVLRTVENLVALPEDLRSKVSDSFVDVLADLHSTDYEALGLGDFGRPYGYLERQVARWSKQLIASRSRNIPGFDNLAVHLRDAVPISARTAIVHGDFRLDNAVIDVSVGEPIQAILDWEMSTLGDPLTDLALFYLYWEGWQGLDNPIAATPTDIVGFPRFEALAERYIVRTGAELRRFEWYKAFAFFKLAVICEGLHYRHLKGMTVGEGFGGIGAMVPQLVRRGLSAVAEDSKGRAR